MRDDRYTDELEETRIVEPLEQEVRSTRTSRSQRYKKEHRRHRMRKEEAREVDDLPKKKVGWVRRLWRRYQLTKVLLILVLLTVLTVGGYLFYLSKTANVGDLEAALKAQTIIYDKDGQEAGSLSGQKGTYVELDAISQHIQNAVIATEDRTFYKNSGVNVGRTLLAIATLGKSGGGSTITQQLAKNAFLTQEQTISRKAREYFLAVEINKKYSKDQILTMYLNNAYFGNGVWGVEDASLKYFGRHASEVTVDQAALIAGMLKGPEIYNPYASVERATNRRNTVLSVMVDAGYLSQADADAAKQVDVSAELSDAYTAKQSNYAYPSYFDAVIAEAQKRYGISESEIINNGYRIYTEMDQNQQATMQAIYDETGMFPIASDGETAESASVALDPKTGGVRAMVGRVASTQAGFRSFNFATQAKRSPGSTIKPLVVYTPALEKGWQIDDLLDNQTTQYGTYHLQNADRTTSEDVPMYQALARSLNLPAVYLANKLGINSVFDYGQKFGLSMDQVDKNLAVSIGSEVTTNPMEMAQAYTAFANGGQMADAHLITRIETASGRELKAYSGGAKRVMSRSTADKMTSMMMGTFTNGTGVYANVSGYTLAGKTGTTETSFNPDLTNDQWVIGYTPDLVIAQWLGFEKTDESHYIDGSNSWMSANLFQTVAASILPYTAGSTFEVENAYYQSGDTSTDYGQEEPPAQASAPEKSWTEKAGDLIEGAKKGIEEADIPGKAANLWDTVTGWLR